MTYLHLSQNSGRSKILFEPHTLWEEDWLALLDWHIAQARAAMASAASHDGLTDRDFGEVGRHIDRAHAIWQGLMGYDMTVTLKESNASLNYVKLNRKRKTQ